MTTSVASELSQQRVSDLISREERRFRDARPRSVELWNESRRVMPRGVPSSFQDAMPQPIFVEHGQGSRVWDVDGNEYVDFHNGFGVVVVGHAHPAIVEAVTRQISRGSHFAEPTADVLPVAQELARRFQQPKWRFTNSGTESTLDAIRLARAFTGRDSILKMEASYHGHHDAVMISVLPDPETIGPAEAPNSVPQSEGVPKALLGLTHVVPFNDLDTVERALAKHQPAAVIVEPAMLNVGIILPDQGYLEGLVERAHRHGALVIFDEVKTGVTIAAGGATERFGVVPDLVCLAKAIGGGLPCGAVGGRDDVMDLIEQKRVLQVGTFNGNPLTMAASRATLYEVLTPQAYAHFEALAEVLQGGIDGVIREYDLPFHAITLGSRGGINYRRERLRNYRDYLQVDALYSYLSWLYQCNRGVLMAPGAEENWTLSVQHSEQDVQRYVDTLAEMARDLRS